MPQAVPANRVTLSVSSEDPIAPRCDAGARSCANAPLYRISGEEFSIKLSDFSEITVAHHRDACETHIWRALEQVRRREQDRGASGYMVIRHRTEIDKLYTEHMG